MNRWIIPALVVICSLHSTSAEGDAPTVTAGWNVLDPVVGDVDGDGRPDLILSGPDVGEIQSLLGNGDGTFQAPRRFTAGSSYVSAILPGDLDGDAKTDLVTVHAYSDENDDLHVLLGNGDGTFDRLLGVILPPVTPPNFSESEQQLTAAALGDLDGDGNLDLVAAAHTVNNVSVYDEEYDTYYEEQVLDGYLNVFRGYGDGTFGTAIVEYLGQDWDVRNLATADYDGDGRADVVSRGQMDFGAWGLSVRLGNGDGTVQTPRETYVGVWGPWVVMPTPVWDFDRDGKLDMLMVDYGGVVFLRGNGDGTFEYGESAPFGAGDSVHTTLVGDVNVDGIPDVVAVRGSTTWKYEEIGYDEYGPIYRQYDPVTRRSASVLLGYGNGMFDLSASWDLGVVASANRFEYPVLADFDGDGRPDLLSSIPYDLAFARNAGGWPAATPSIRIGDATVTEADSGTSPAAFTVRLLVPQDEEISVDYRTVADSASLGGDVVAASGTVRFAPGETSKTVVVQVVGDSAYESVEVFAVELSNASSNASIADGRGLGTIIDNDPHAEVSIGDVTVTEGDVGTTPAVFAVHLSAPYPGEVTVDYTTYSGSAVLGSDFVAASGTVRFAPGEVSKSIVVDVVGERLHEASEYFYVVLFGATPAGNITVAQYMGIGTILDTDPLPDVRINDVSRPEGRTGGTQFQFTVTLSTAQPEAVTVYYRTVDGTAQSVTKKRPSGDYTEASGTLSFSPGTTTKTISVQVRGDREVEADETFRVEIYKAPGASVADGSGLGTILNDD